MEFAGVGVASQLSPPPLEPLLEPLLAPLLLVLPLPLLELPLLELLLAPEELLPDEPPPLLELLLELPLAPDELLEDALPLELPPESASAPAGPLGRLGDVAQATKEQNPTRTEAGV